MPAEADYEIDLKAAFCVTSGQKGADVTVPIFHEEHPPPEEMILEAAIRNAYKTGIGYASGPFARHRKPSKGKIRLGNRPLYLFFDEAGDFNMGIKGSKLFILTCVMTDRPFRCADDLLEMRRDLLERSESVEYFHATNDTRKTRAEVFERIRLYENEFAVYYAAVEKSSNDPLFSTPADIYCNLFDTIFSSVERDFELGSASMIIAVTDHLPSDVKKKEYTQRLKSILKKHAPGNFTIAHHRSMSDCNLQIADYYCWAIQRDREHNDSSWTRSLKAIRSGTEYSAPLDEKQKPSDI